jgi:antidote-toxin recognition MazE-like antitoxin
MRDYRERMRAAGLRPIQLWVPDLNAKGFRAKLRRQVARLDREQETGALDFIEAAESDL